jgi:cytochrome c556
MPLTRITAIALAGLMSIGLVAGVIAEDTANTMMAATDDFVVPGTPEEIVAARKALMKEDGGILKDAGGLTGDDAAAAMEKVYTNFTHIPLLFPEGSIVGDSKALPAIWENWDTFTGIVEKGKTALMAAADAAKKGDADGYTAQLKVLGGVCGECHMTFRGH